MRVRNHGKYTKMSKLNPRAIGTCDYSGLMVRHAHMVPQVAYRGRGIVKTGFLVNPRFYDNPNPQDLTPLVYVDPRPVLNPRPDSIIDNPTTPTLYLDVSGGQDIILNPVQYNNTQMIFTGVLTSDITILVPAFFNEFFVTNKTTGPHTLSMQIIDISYTKILLPRGLTPLIFNDCFTLTFSHPT